MTGRWLRQHVGLVQDAEHSMLLNLHTPLALCMFLGQHHIWQHFLSAYKPYPTHPTPVCSKRATLCVLRPHSMEHQSVTTSQMALPRCGLMNKPCACQIQLYAARQTP